MLLAHQEQISAWVGQDKLSIVKVEQLLTRQGVNVPYPTLHRFAVARCGFRPKGTTVRVLAGEPGVECQIDFAQMGFILDPETGKKHRVHALIFTACYSRHMFVWLTYSQTLSAVIAGCESAWKFYSGVFKVLIPDNLRPVATSLPNSLSPARHTGRNDARCTGCYGIRRTRVTRCHRQTSGSFLTTVRRPDCRSQWSAYAERCRSVLGEQGCPGGPVR